MKVYVENLKNLTEHPEIWKTLGLPYHSTVWPDGTDEMENSYEDGKTSDVESVSVYEVKSNMWE